MKKDLIYCLLPLLLSIVFLFTGNLLLILVSILIAFFIFIKKRNFKNLMLSLFLTYISGIVYYTTFCPTYNRTFSITSGLTFEYIINYLKSCNFIPFKTILGYIKRFFIFSEEITQEVILVNLIGNFICLIPFAIFIPFFFKKFKSRKKFTLLIILITFIIELFQLITMNGSFDVDDIILNSSGCILFYLLFYTEINRFYDNFKFANNTKEIVIFSLKITLLISISLIITILFLIRNEKETKYWNEYHFGEIELINYPEVCTIKTKSYIYEDELYKYYINCASPENIIIDINNKKFSLMDYLEGKTMYPVLINHLDAAGLEMETEEKNEKLVVCTEKTTNPHYGFCDRSVIKIVQTTEEIESEKNCSSYFIIPVGEGSSDLIFDYDGEIIKYQVTVDSDKNLNIELSE